VGAGVTVAQPSGAGDPVVVVVVTARDVVDGWGFDAVESDPLLQAATAITRSPGTRSARRVLM
jgi:hypothetical protein